jgi:oxygen-dependent protoporphyrinogen oxidase
MDAILPDLRKPFPRIEGMVHAVRVYRWEHAWTVFRTGALHHLGRFLAGGMETDPRIALAGDYLSAPNVEGAVVAGLRAAARVLAGGGRP